MIPIRDEIRTKRVPYINYILIAINIIVFLLMVFSSNKATEAMVMNNALIPARLTQGFSIGALKTLVTSLFMHAGWMHLISNMLYLWIFGDNIEDRLGHLGFLLFYLGAGVFASVLHIIFNANSVGLPWARLARLLGSWVLISSFTRVQGFIRLSRLGFL